MAHLPPEDKTLPLLPDFPKKNLFRIFVAGFCPSLAFLDRCLSRFPDACAPLNFQQPAFYQSELKGLACFSHTVRENLAAKDLRRSVVWKPSKFAVC
ncbi:MAG TPA: hypothetical protein DCX79_05690 [Planctomycetaceae bacterium]|nr:hypothetical protein [Planctomycetaceae bacterium]